MVWLARDSSKENAVFSWGPRWMDVSRVVIVLCERYYFAGVSVGNRDALRRGSCNPIAFARPRGTSVLVASSHQLAAIPVEFIGNDPEAIARIVDSGVRDHRIKPFTPTTPGRAPTERGTAAARTRPSPPAAPQSHLATAQALTRAPRPCVGLWPAVVRRCRPACGSA